MASVWRDQLLTLLLCLLLIISAAGASTEVIEPLL